MTRAKGVLLAFMTALYFCVIQEAGGTIFEIMNECLFTVWPATLGGGHQLERGQSWTFEVPANSTKGRIWGRTGCVFGGFCETGECGAVATCEVAQSVPATTFEYSIDGRMERDYFGISLVGGFNLPMSIIPTDRQCQAIACSSDINSVCPEGLRKPNACMSACTIFNTSEYCCTGTSSDAGKCDSSNYSRFFKTQCPQARSYDFDNVTSNFTCHSGTDYKIVFCRTEGRLFSLRDRSTY